MGELKDSPSDSLATTFLTHGGATGTRKFKSNLFFHSGLLTHSSRVELQLQSISPLSSCRAGTCGEQHRDKEGVGGSSASPGKWLGDAAPERGETALL